MPKIPTARPRQARAIRLECFSGVLWLSFTQAVGDIAVSRSVMARLIWMVWFPARAFIAVISRPSTDFFFLPHSGK